MTYENCTELRKDYPHGVKKGHPAYARQHDRDKDGYACEKSGAEGQAAVGPVKEASAGTKAEASAGHAERLPQTGPGEVTAIGAFILIMGAVVAVAFRRRTTRFTA